MSDATLIKTRIHAGAYEGVLTWPAEHDPDIALIFLEEPVGEVTLTQDTALPGTWLVKCNVPHDVLGDGVQTFLIMDQTSGQKLDYFTIVTGEPLSDDLRAEIDLLRAELDMLKKAFRRHCVETS